MRVAMAAAPRPKQNWISEELSRADGGPNTKSKASNADAGLRMHTADDKPIASTNARPEPNTATSSGKGDAYDGPYDGPGRSRDEEERDTESRGSYTTGIQLE